MAGTDAAALIAAGTTVLDRLKARAKASGTDTMFLMRKFALERLMVRLVETGNGDRYCLKGGMVMLLVGGGMGRPTEDLDFTAMDPFEPVDLLSAFGTACGAGTAVQDGLTFELHPERCQTMREEEINPGLRIIATASLHTRYGINRIALKIDASHGDPINPEARMAALTETCKGYDPPEMPVMPWETVVAEKLHGICKHGLGNTRLKDFYDLIAISRNVGFSGPALADAVSRTFSARASATMEPCPVGLGDGFARGKEKDWAKFMGQRGLGIRVASMVDAVAEIREFSVPLMTALSRGDAFDADWAPGEGWGVGSPPPSPFPG